MRETMAAVQVEKNKSILEKIDNSQKFLEGRLDHINTLEDRIRMIEDKCQQVQNVALNTKNDIFETWNKQKLETLATEEKLARHEARLEKTVGEASVKMDAYSKTYNDAMT